MEKNITLGSFATFLTRYTDTELLKCKSQWGVGRVLKLAPQEDKEQVTKRQDMTFFLLYSIIGDH